MSKQKMDELKHLLCRELDQIADKGELSAGDLETAQKLTDTIKNIHKINMLEYADGYSGDDVNRSYYGNAYGRYHDNMGRYAGNDRYSGRTYVRGYYRDGIKDKLEDLMHEAGTEKERKAIQRAMDLIE